MSDTPETDALREAIDNGAAAEAEMTSLAGKLERERDNLQATGGMQVSDQTPLPNIWAQYGLTEPIPLRNGSEDWVGGGYQEQCMKCGILFWGQRDAPFCKSCAEQAKEAVK